MSESPYICIQLSEINTLSSITPFPIHLKNALTALGLKCEIDNSDTPTFVFLHILKDENVIFKILTIGICKWKEESDLTAYQNYIDEQQKARQNGLLFMILWEDYWMRSQDIVLSRIQAMVGDTQKIPGRLTSIQRIDKHTTDQFLSKNHLLGDVSSKYRYGLFLPVRYFRVLNDSFIGQSFNTDQDLLVAVATFSNARIFKKDQSPYRSCELIRFASLKNTTIVGGIDKLLSAFVKDFQPDDLMTYIDLEWSDGNGFKRIGFDEISTKASIYFDINISNFSRTPAKTENSPIDTVRIPNAGSRKFVKVFKTATNS